MDATIFCNNFILPKRRFWKVEETFPTAFSKHFARVSTAFGLQNVEKFFENALGKVSSAFQITKDSRSASHNQHIASRDYLL